MRKKLYNWLCDITHVVLGVVVALSWEVHWTLTLVGAGSFIIYELDEAKKTKDLAYQDIREFLWGLFVTVIILLWRLI